MSLYSRRNCKTLVGTKISQHVLTQKSLSYFTDVIYWNKSRSYQGIKDKTSKKIARE